MNFITFFSLIFKHVCSFVPTHSFARYGAIHLVSIPDGNLELVSHYSPQQFCFPGVWDVGRWKKRITLWMCAPTWVSLKVISVPCYGVSHMRLCQFSRERTEKAIYGYNSACFGSIACLGGVIIIIFIMEGERMKREIFVESFFSGLWFSLDSLTLPWSRRKTSREVLACILQLKSFERKKDGRENWMKIDVAREQIVVGMFFHLPLNLRATAKWCLI